MDEQLKNKLFNFSPQPPDEVWAKINSALDEQPAEDFIDKLIKYESAPPPGVWNNIADALQENRSPVISFRKRYSKTLRYFTAAACVVGIVVLASVLINRKPVSKTVANKPAEKQNIASSKSINGTQQLPDTFFQNTDSTNHDLVSIKKVHSKKVSLLQSSEDNNISERTDYVLSHNYPINTSAELDRYIVLSTATGEAFRLSKKLFDLFACSTDNEKCRKNIESMQQQMASPAMMASADFSGLMDILQSINNQ